MPPIRRQRSEPIVRVRTGCFTCRRRKKKCNESKPVCAGCARNKLDCSWPASTPTPPPDSDATPSGGFQSCNVQSNRQRQDTPSSPSSPGLSDPRPPLTGPFPSENQLLYTDPTDQDSSMDLLLREMVPMGSPNSIVPETPGNDMGIVNMLPRSLSMLPGHDPECFQLLSHYLGTTADCMSNGSTPINPFLVQVVPLAFSSDLVLQLVLTQSAAHRAFRSKRDVDDTAEGQYTKALRLFRKGVTEFIDGEESSPLLLTVGALIMCFTETAKGDMNGTVFDHLSAAHSLLIQLLLRSNTTIPKDLDDFIIDYYTYTATVSMISIDARVSSQRLLDSDMEQRAHRLINCQYVGNLSGCWLELLLVIPRIFDLGRRWMIQDDQPGAPTTDNIVVFGSLQAEIMRWTPYTFVSQETRLAGLIFQQAMLLYLVTSLGMFSDSAAGAGSALMNCAIAEAMALLRRVSATSRINSGLCWPIAVVGSCLSDPGLQEELRQRLTTMGNAFGLGNMHRTLLLLEHMWQLPLHDAGPWNICRAMQQKQIWISFA